jgi:hypothetical protein
VYSCFDFKKCARTSKFSFQTLRMCTLMIGLRVFKYLPSVITFELRLTVSVVLYLQSIESFTYFQLKIAILYMLPKTFIK